MAASPKPNLHDQVPPGYYQRAIKVNPFQSFWHRHRFQQISRIIKPVKGEILDIGSCDGTFSQIIQQRSKAKKLIGIDIVSSQVKYAQNRFQHNKKFKFLVADAQNLPFKANRFDAVFCLEALEHVPQPLQVIKQAYRVTKPGGYLVILVPTDSVLFNLLWWVVLHTWGRHWQETHVNSFHQSGSLPQLIKSAGYQIEVDRKFLWNMLQVVRARK